MSVRWAAVLPADAAPQAAVLRRLPGIGMPGIGMPGIGMPGIEACLCGDQLWLRGGEGMNAELEGLLRAIARQRYTCLADGGLIPAGQRTPSGFLPDGPWHPLAEVLQVELPEILPPAPFIAPVSVRLTRSSAAQPINLLQLDADSWLACVERAAEERLQKWAFAAHADGRILVRGTPPPSAPGIGYVEMDGVAVEAGWALFPALDVAVFREAFQADDDELLLLTPASAAEDAHPDESTPTRAILLERIPQEHFVRATRSAARLTCRRSP